MPGRPRTGIGTFGSISTVANGSKAFTASTRVRDCDGRLRRVTALGSTKASAVAALKAMLPAGDEAGAAGETVTADMPFVALAQLWLEDIKIDPRLSDGTKAVYESELRTLVLPTFAHFTLREVSTARVERFLTAQSVKSYAKAKHSKVILNLLMRYAQRHDAIRHNPVDGTSALKRPPVAPKALTMDDLQAIRHSARTWRSGGSYPGPKPDGQLGDLIEVMLGTSARIGEALAIRKCDGDVPSNPPIVHICGTIVVRTGKGTSRQPWTKTSTSDRTVAIPQFAAEVIRKRLSAVDGREPEHLLFFTKYGTPITPYNARRTFRQVLEHAGLADRGITPRSFRKTVATLISQDADAETAAE
ncbi:MAG: Site-specific recombinase XerD, partial [Mycetocola sp.]|nr:Site-specific recombinase XerD [Mycetocola sp.]